MNRSFLLPLMLMLCTAMQASDYSGDSSCSETEHESGYSGESEDVTDSDDPTFYGRDPFDSENEKEEKQIVYYWDERERCCLPYPFESANLLVHILSLSLDDCNLREVPSLLPPNLTELALDSNNIEQVQKGFSWPIGLQTLDLSFNKLKKVPQGLPDSLTVLLLKGNAIRKFPTKLPKSLNLLDLASNNIDDLSNGIEIPGELNTIRLQQNGVCQKIHVFILEDTVNASRQAGQPRLTICID